MSVVEVTSLFILSATEWDLNFLPSAYHVWTDQVTKKKVACQGSGVSGENHLQAPRQMPVPKTLAHKWISPYTLDLTDKQHKS